MLLAVSCAHSRVPIFEGQVHSCLLPAGNKYPLRVCVTNCNIMRQDRLYRFTDSSTVMNTSTWMVFDKMRQCLLTFKSTHFTVAEAV